MDRTPALTQADRKAATQPKPFSDLAAELDAILDACIAAGEPVAILQFPYDGNVGNHLMWIGITDYLRERGIPVRYVAHGSNFRENDLARAIGKGTILFSGGVTISRLWPRHAEVKRAVAAAFPKNPLVSLPSTVMFVDQDDRDHARDIFGAHPNATVLTRDPRSYEQARAAFPDGVVVQTCPDLAFRLPAQPVRSQARYDTIWLARDDIEGIGKAPPEEVHVFDWSNDLRANVPRGYYLLRASGVLSRLRSSTVGPISDIPANQLLAESYRLVSHNILSYGNRLLDTGKVLVTDRMHPHILAALRGQPAVLLPDKFGKNRAVYDFYTRTSPYVHWSDTPAEALNLARSLAR